MEREGREGGVCDGRAAKEFYSDRVGDDSFFADIDEGVDWEDLTSSIPAYLLVTGIVFTYSISDGLGMGVISYTILNCGKKGRVHWVMWLVSALFVLKYICLGIK